MSYMHHNAAFAPADGIQELSFDEIEAVGGGPASRSEVLAAGAAIAGAGAVALAVVGAPILAPAVIAYGVVAAGFALWASFEALKE